MPENELDDALLERYARHLILKEFGFDAQEILNKKKLLMVGAGGLGASALMFLASSGIGHIGIIDDDVVSLSNLQRQLLYTQDDISKPKCLIAKERLEQINQHLNYMVYYQPCNDEFAKSHFTEYDIICDGSDNYATRILVNRYAMTYKIPLVSAAIVGFEGQISVFDHNHGSGCYQCLYPKMPDMRNIPRCDTVGVFAPIAGILGAMMASEAIKVIANIGDNLIGKLWLMDILQMRQQVIAIPRDKNCDICRKL